VIFDNGSDPAAAAAAAAAADVAVVFGYVRMGEFADLTDLRLQGNGDALISAVSAANPDTVVVLQTGSAVEMPWLVGVPAVLENWHAGAYSRLEVTPVTTDGRSYRVVTRRDVSSPHVRSVRPAHADIPTASRPDGPETR